MSQFEFFYNNWLNVEPVIYNKNQDEYVILPVNLPDNFFETLDFSKKSLKEYRITAAQKCKDLVGDNPALCFSGGADSQAMLQCYQEAGLKFTLYTFKFENDLNMHDLYHARYFCNKYNINLIELPINVKTFLNRENFEIAEKYNSISPHFNVHYKMFDMLKDMGHSGVVCGGQTVICNYDFFNDNPNKDFWGGNFSKNPMNFVHYSKLNNYPVQGSFLSYYPKLCWAISLLTIKSNINLSRNIHVNHDDLERDRYTYKINGYVKSGFRILPQERKSTGFELVKKHYESLTGDPWEFEKRFRIPLVKNLKTTSCTAMFDLSEKQEKEIEDLYCRLMSESLLFSNYHKIFKSYHVDESDINNMRPW